MIELSFPHREIILKILAKYAPDNEIRVFGSRVQGTSTKTSDLDIALKGKERISRQAMNRLEEAFEYSDLPFRVDVLDWNALTPEFQKVIEQHYELLI